MLNLFLYSSIYWKSLLLIALTFFLGKQVLAILNSEVIFKGDVLATILLGYIYYWINSIDKSSAEYGGFYYLRKSAFLRMIFIGALLSCAVLVAVSSHVLLEENSISIESVLVLLSCLFFSFLFFRIIRLRIIELAAIKKNKVK